MKRRSFLRNFFKTFIISFASIVLFNSFIESSTNSDLSRTQNEDKNPNEILKKIYDEVIELGRYEKEDFLRRDFFMNLDEEDKSTREHVVVLIHKEGEIEKMMLQVTYLESRVEDSIIKHAKNTKKISTIKKGNRLKIEESGYEEEEIKSLLPKILQNIRLKKEYLKLIKKDK